MKSLIQYLEDKKIEFSLTDSDNEVIIDDNLFYLVKPQNGLLFDENFHLIVDSLDYDTYVYNFGGSWFYDKKDDIENPKLNELIYIGKYKRDLETNTFLGVRGAYEILNGSRQYDDWCKKAKFLGVTSLGICEKNTLAGVMKFQLECQKNDIKPIIGATYTVYRASQDLHYDVKFYIENEQGWHNLLMINKEINVDNEFKRIDEEKLLNFIEGLFLIADPKSISYEDFAKIRYRDLYDFYQLDTVQFEDESRDKWYLDNLKKFYYSGLSPISITDAFYLEKEHSHIKGLLNDIRGYNEFKSKNQYFKSKEDYFDELNELFSSTNDEIFTTFSKCVNNENAIAKLSDFVIEINKFHLPEYTLTEDQKLKYGDIDNLFWSLIKINLNKKVEKSLHEVYLKRIEYEYSVLMQGEKLLDYMLILWDIIDWCNENDIIVGIGRGSSGGSLISYLLGITNLDPIKYNLLFERFLNENRVKKSLPDIDSDFEGLRRDNVKEYMEQRFGFNNVCSVGTYGNLKLKMLLTDLCRLNNIPIQEVKIMTKILDEDEFKGTVWSSLFKIASTSSKLKSFIKKYPEIINNLKLCLNQPRSISVHACATIITPKNKEIFEWIPLRKIDKNDGKILISEWEGEFLDKAGFLKEDILGLLQLDKFASIIKMIKVNTGVKIDIRDIPLDDKNVYRYFSHGWNEDVFQFGTHGLKKYTSELKPDNLEELFAVNALYRPGAMKSNAHNDFVDIKFGKKNPEYDYMLEEVTKNTYGLYLYQEQTMLAAQKLGGFSLVEADMMRKVMLGRGKKQQADQFYIYHDKFIKGAEEKGCSIEEAEKIWLKLEAFSGYGFNRSHAAAYAITGYISQWFKVNYPLEFWATAFKFTNEDKTPNYINEIQQTGAIRLIPVDINSSRDETYADKNKNTIYWSLSSVKYLGEISVKQIIEDREKDGQYFSFEEFLSRHTFKGSKVNKTVIENLITCGAFDELEKIHQPKDRFKLIDKFREINKVKVDKEKDIYSQLLIFKNWWWSLMQKSLSGISFFDYRKLTDEYLESKNYFCSADELQLDSYSRYSSNVKVGGLLVEYNERENKKGKWCRMVLESNYDFIDITVWPEQFELIKHFEFENQVGKIILLSGEINKDKYLNKNIVQMSNNSEIMILG